MKIRSGPTCVAAVCAFTLGMGASSATTYTGSGVIIGRNGEILTAAHVVPNCRSVQISRPLERPISADVVARDAQNDFALLRSKTIIGPPVALRAGPPMRTGESVIAVGYPLAGLLSSEPNLTTGIVSATAGLGDDVRFLQVTVPVQPGNSGGPLLDGEGHLVGIVTGKLDFRVARISGALPENVNFALKSDMAVLFLNSFNVPFNMAKSVLPIPTTGVADLARRFTVFISCQRGGATSGVDVATKATGPDRARNRRSDWAKRLHKDWFHN